MDLIEANFDIITDEQMIVLKNLPANVNFHGKNYII